MTERTELGARKAATFKVTPSVRWEDFKVARTLKSVASEPKTNSGFSRREFIKLSLLALGGALSSSLLSGCGAPDGHETDELKENDFLLKTHEVDLGEGHVMSVEAHEYEMPNSPKQFPDTHLSVFGPIGGYVLYGTAGVESVKIEGNSMAELTEQRVVLQPRGDNDEHGYGGYRGLSGVVGLGDGKMAGLYHEERWPNGSANGWPFTARIGLVMSSDYGRTWNDVGVVMTGDEVVPMKQQVQGVGQPCAIISGDSVYAYYTDWPASGHAKVCVARAKIAELGDPNAWKKYDGVGFNSPGLGGKAQPVLSIAGGGNYAALPGISWNEKIGKFLMMMESNSGFYVSTAPDGFSWSEPKLLVEFPMSQSQTINQVGADWWSYPTLMSESSARTKEGGLLICSRGKRQGVKLHRAVMIPWSIT